ncbi:hypothetical protein CD033_03895 [Staphylococcus argenteus]|nr:hypothetical protein CD033_03895 [Staphylococcus argenteus]
MYMRTNIYVISIIGSYVEAIFLIMTIYLINKYIDLTMLLAYYTSKNLALYDYILFQTSEIYQYLRK